VQRLGLLLTGAVVILLIVAAISSVFSAKTRRPPVVQVVHREPVDIINDEGVEMWFVTLSISNSECLLPTSENEVYVQDANRRVEAKVGERWVSTEGHLGRCKVAPGRLCEKDFLVPVGTRTCRVPLRYTGARLLMRGSLAKLAENLPSRFRSQLSYKFWRWVGFDRYAAGRSWSEITIDVPLETAAQP